VGGPAELGREKAEAAFKIEFARRRSAFSRFNRLSSTDSSAVTPPRAPCSTSAWRTHLRTDSGVVTPSSCATLAIAAHSES